MNLRQSQIMPVSKGNSRLKHSHGIFVGGIDILLLSRDGDFDFVRVLLDSNHTEIRADFIVTLGSPRDIAIKAWLERAINGARYRRTVR